MVFAAAPSPGLIGITLDAGVALETQLLVMAAYCFLAALCLSSLLPRLQRLATT